MKSLTICFFILLAGKIHGQQNFQGTIVYNLHASKEKNDAELTIQFGPNKIKVKFKEKQEYDKTYLLIDLDSAKIFTINTEEKTFKSKPIEEVKPLQTIAPKTIAGYATTPALQEGRKSNGILAFLFTGNTILYPANDLYFAVPQKYAGNPELIMIQNNHIVLGADITMGSSFGGGEDESNPALMMINVEAKNVQNGTLDVADFMIPQGFTKEVRHNWPMTDSVDVAVDSLDSVGVIDAPKSEPSSKKPAPKPKTATPKKTTPQKGEATKKKKTS
jgi:hypothetical protein